MNFIKCPKCGKEEPAFDYAHVCGNVQVKKSFNKRLRDFERESKLEIFGLGARRERWEKALEKYAELVIKDCIEINKQELSFTALERLMNKYEEHFGVEQRDENQNTEKR
jgi:hypothetical protein